MEAPICLNCEKSPERLIVDVVAARQPSANSKYVSNLSLQIMLGLSILTSSLVSAAARSRAATTSSRLACNKHPLVERDVSEQALMAMARIAEGGFCEERIRTWREVRNC